MALTVGTNSWVTVSEADTYFSDRVGTGDYWNDDAEKAAALVTAYKELTNSGHFNLPSTATQVMKDAQCEYALYLLIHEPDRSIRAGLITQGVVEAGVVKEKYSSSIRKLKFPPMVESLLDAYSSLTPFAIFDIERDEEQTTDYNAPGNLTRDT